MLKSLKNLITSPLTKYMGIAILALVTALGGATYLSYKFYGDKQVAEQQNRQLAVVVEEEKEQTDRAIESKEVIGDAVSNVREGEKEIDNAVEKLQERISKDTPSNPTEVKEDEAESTTEPCGYYLSDDDIRVLRMGHCVTDGDASDCD